MESSTWTSFFVGWLLGQIMQCTLFCYKDYIKINGYVYTNALNLVLFCILMVQKASIVVVIELSVMDLFWDY